MSHSITFVDDDALPADYNFLFVELPAGAHIFYRASAVTEENLEDSWAAYRALKTHPPVEPQSAVPLTPWFAQRELLDEPFRLYCVA